MTVNSLPPAFDRHRRRCLQLLVAAATLGVAVSVGAHETKAGDITIGHPFAVPTPAGASTGAAYFASLENAGGQADRLLGASTPAAARVELHTMNVDGNGVMRMRALEAIALAPKETVRMRPGGGMHLMLIGLKAPLVDGQSFPMTLRFERAGTVEVKVVVQVPRPRDAPAEAHAH